MPHVSHLTVKLEEADVHAIAHKLAELLGQHRSQPVAESNPPAPEPQTAWSAQEPQEEADPWTTATPAPPTRAAQAAPATAATAAYPAAPQPGPTSAAPAASGTSPSPTCNHGPMRFVRAGVSQTSGRPYPAFYGCPAPRNAPDKCPSVQA